MRLEEAKVAPNGVLLRWKNFKMLTEERNYYKPFEYNWAFEHYKSQQHMHWLPDEVPMADDLKDYRSLDDNSKRLLGHIFRFFTQSDVDVCCGSQSTICQLSKHLKCV